MAGPLKMRGNATWIPAGPRQVTVGRKTIVTLYGITGEEYRRPWYFEARVIGHVIRMTTEKILDEGRRLMNRGLVLRGAVDGEFLDGDWWEQLKRVETGMVGHVHIPVAILAGPYQVTGVR